MQEARRTIEEVARSSYGRLLAYLSSRTRDVAGAEDALGDALLSALNTWPRDGVPKNPEAWLLTSARNRLVDHARHARVQEEHAEALELLLKGSGETGSADEWPDERLKLFFVCAHPAIDHALHTPLMLQTVLGLDAARIAQAFLVQPPAMGQRLSRAKKKIREAGIPFEIPLERDWPARLTAVLEAVYAAYGLGWDEAVGADPRGRDLVNEAVWLARVLRQRMPKEPEARGLFALMLFCDARQNARRTPGGAYVPLSEQDPASWSIATIGEAESELASAAGMGRIGRFQLEAAIQSVHCDRARSGRTDWSAIVTFYEQLVRLAPTLGVRVGQAAAVAETLGAEAGLSMLDTLEGHAVVAYQPYWAVRAHLLQRLGRLAPAARAFDRAIGLTEDEAVRKFLLARRDQP
jgi:RNA polymerase sigma-70 factor (ECF subfamily)